LQPAPERGGASARLRRTGRSGAFTLLALLALVLPLRVARAAIENSLWIDEIASLMLASHPLGAIVDHGAVDTNPPGYFFALKIWLKLAKLAGAEPGVLWARLLGTLCWLVLALAAWTAGARCRGAYFGAVLAWAVAAGAYAGVQANDARGYSISSVALFVCLAVLVVQYRDGVAGEGASRDSPPPEGPSSDGLPSDGLSRNGSPGGASDRDGPSASRASRRALLLWLVYAAAASTAMWTHLLAAPVCVLLGLAWLLLALAIRRRCPSFLYLGGLAHLLVGLSFLPWLLHLRAEVESLRESAVGWMTPATVPNLLAVFAYWYPFGRIAGPDQPAWQLYDSLGALSLLAPLAAALWAARRRARPRQDFQPAAAASGEHLPPGDRRPPGDGRPPERGGPPGDGRPPKWGGPSGDGRLPEGHGPLGDSRPLLVLALCGFGVSLLFVGLLWALQRLGLMTVFFAPRYPALTAAPWAAGLAALSAWAVERAGWPRARVWFLLLPWLACAGLGQLWAIRAEQSGGLRAMRQRFSPLLPPGGSRLYVLPADLLPFFRRTFGRFDLRPIEELPCALRKAAPATAATVLDLNFWHVLDHPQDLVARRVIADGELAGRVERASFPDWRADFNVYRLSSISPAKAADLCAHGFEPPSWNDPPRALASALAENQKFARGWSFPELGPDLRLRRWASRPIAEVLFDRPLAPGRYQLHYSGYRAGFPEKIAHMELRLEGDPAAHAFDVPEGPIEIELGFTLARTARRPLLRVTHPMWTPRAATGSSDARHLASLFSHAWIEASPTG
jgi:hypothetical protein